MNVKNVPNVSVFKNKLKETSVGVILVILMLVRESILYIVNTRNTRNNTSYLNSDHFSLNLADSSKSIDCDALCEDASHSFLECLAYNNYRLKLFDNIKALMPDAHTSTKLLLF
jgi:hypothetical protein